MAPGCDVAGADIVGVRSIAAPGANELRLRAAVRFVDISALRARAARVARVHGHKGHAGERGLVSEERAQLSERPTMQTRPLGLPNGYPVANPSQIFYCDAATGVFGFTNDGFANHVIRVGVESLLPPAELAKVALGRLGSCGLKSRPKLGNAGSNSEGLLSGMRISVRVDGEIADTEVDAKPAFGIDGAPIGHVDGYEKEELALAVDEVGLSADAFESSAMVRADGARHDNAAIKREKAA